MSIPGLSLVGFMELQQAVNYQRILCVPTDPADAALLTEWNMARGKLGVSVVNAGNPDIQDIPPADQAYIQQLSQQPWVQQSLAPGSAFKVVEIDPLLAFQFHVLTNHSDNHCGGLGLGPGISDLLPIFLPQVPQQEALRVSVQGQSVIIAADSLNVRIMAQGIFQAENKVGIQFGSGLPFVHVARFNGRCYLMNGFHRALGARKRGAGRMPCLFRDVATYAEVGIRDDGSTFSVSLLESANPPTLGHFTQNRAHEVAIRNFSRILQVNWSEHALPLE